MVRVTISSGAQSLQNKLLGQGLLESAFDGMIPSGNVKQPRHVSKIDQRKERERHFWGFCMRRHDYVQEHVW